MRGLTMSLLRSAEAELDTPADLAPVEASMRWRSKPPRRRADQAKCLWVLW